MTNLVGEYLSQFDARLFSFTEGRWAVARWDLQAFAFIYFRKSLSNADGEVTMSEFHTAFCRDAYRLTQTSDEPGESRRVWTCPRNAGKSTWTLILLAWLAAFEHQGFIALFSATQDQAIDRVEALRREFNDNQLLRKDFPELCKPLRRRNGVQVSDTKTRIQQANGFTMVARGIDTSVLGMLDDQMRRPAVIVLDDPEGGEGNYSQGDADKRLRTIQDDILPLSVKAHVVWIGTTTRPGGLMHQLVNHSLGIESAEWIEQEGFKVRYMPALLKNADGTERSLWPEMWSLDWLQSQKGTRSFAKNYMNLPSPDDSDYWNVDSFVYRDDPDANQTIISIDPAVTSKKTSDETGIAVVSRNAATGMVVVRHCEGVRLGPAELRLYVLKLIEHYNATLIYLETNQGGDTWQSVFHDMPVSIKTVVNTKSKLLRAQSALNQYERRKVTHAHRLADLETQMISFPHAAHDDMVDSVSQAVRFFLPDVTAAPLRGAARTTSYVK